MKVWHHENITRTHIVRILECVGHVCTKRDSNAMLLSEFELFLSQKNTLLIDQKRNQNEFTVVFSEEGKPKFTIRAKTLAGAVKKLLSLPEASEVDLIVSDQSQIITIPEAETAMTWSKRQGITVLFHPYGLRLPMQALAERKHLHSK